MASEQTTYRANPDEYVRRKGEELIRATDGDNETTVLLNVSQYELSILTGALASFAPEGYLSDGATADYLRERVVEQTPDGWDA